MRPDRTTRAPQLHSVTDSCGLASDTGLIDDHDGRGDHRVRPCRDELRAGFTLRVNAKIFDLFVITNIMAMVLLFPGEKLALCIKVLRSRPPSGSNNRGRIGARDTSHFRSEGGIAP